MKFLPLVYFSTLVLPFGAAEAASVAIVNHDFETGGVADGSFTNSPGVVPTGWSAVGGDLGGFFGYFNPTGDDAYIGATDTEPSGGTVGTMDGANVFYFGTATTGQGIGQTLSENFAANTTYALTVALGSRLDNTEFTANMTINLLAGSTVIATRTARNTAFDGSFADFTLDYTYSVTDSALVGQALGIQFLELDDVADGEVDIDNIRLTAVPEPAAFSLVAGTLALAGLRRRRRGSV
jgi:hypothetical protein